MNQELSSELLKLSLAVSTKSHVLEDFEIAACFATNCTPSQLYSQTRKRKFVQARSLCFTQLKFEGKHRVEKRGQVIKSTYMVVDIGERYDKDHASVLYCIREWDKFIRQNDKVTLKINNNYNKYLGNGK